MEAISLHFCRSQSRGSEEEVYILPAIYTAVINNRETAREQLGDELIEKLGSLSYDNRNMHFFNAPLISRDHEAFKEILHINHSF